RRAGVRPRRAGVAWRRGAARTWDVAPCACGALEFRRAARGGRGVVAVGRAERPRREGTFRGGSPRGGPELARARPRGGAPSTVPLVKGAARQGVGIRLEGGGVLEGEVRDAEGRPAAGATVTVLREGEPLPPRRLPHQWYVFADETAQAKAALPSGTTDAA